jgi:hypothetical protein
MNASLDSMKVLHLQDYRPEAVQPPAPAVTAVDHDLCREKLFVQVILCDAQPAVVGRTWSCRTVRVNADYVEFLCDHPLPVGALVDLWIDLAARPGKFFLSGRVRWTRPGEDSQELVGIELEDGAATDYESWRELDF